MILLKFKLTIQPTRKKGSQMIKNIQEIKKLEKEFKEMNAEISYYYEFEGIKTFEVVIDVPKGSDVPAIITPLFKRYEARILVEPVTTLSELKKKISKKNRSK